MCQHFQSHATASAQNGAWATVNPGMLKPTQTNRLAEGSANFISSLLGSAAGFLIMSMQTFPSCSTTGPNVDLTSKAIHMNVGRSVSETSFDKPTDTIRSITADRRMCCANPCRDTSTITNAAPRFPRSSVAISDGTFVYDVL